MILPTVSIIIFLSYSILIGIITIGWLKLKVFRHVVPSPEVIVSIIVAARDESVNINRLLNSLLNQDYPSHLYEIIIVDDHSTDNTTHLTEQFIHRQTDAKQLRLITLSGDTGSGKKAALNQGIQASTGELIIITDADCTAGSGWIRTIASFYAFHTPQMILGPVRMTDGGSFFGKLQSLEFMSLISTAAGSCSSGFPLLANGANIAFTRIAFESCGGFTGNMQYPSGDDMFLLMSLKKKFGVKAIRFLRSAEATVDTGAIQQLKPFIEQRLRWVSKSRGYTDPLLIAASLIVFLANTCLVTVAFSGFIFPEYIKLFIVLFIIKTGMDFPLMCSFSRFQRKESLLWLFPLMEVLNAFYTLVIGIAGNVVKYEWKGRK